MSTFTEKPVRRRLSWVGVHRLTPACGLNAQILEGWLHKRATKSGVKWAKRYFRLYSNRLTYASGAGSSVKGTMEFTAEFFVQDGPAPSAKFGFVVTDLVTAHHLAADTKDAKEFWMHAVAGIIRKQLDKVCAALCVGRTDQSSWRTTTTPTGQVL
jgi:hypothetical protein